MHKNLDARAELAAKAQAMMRLPLVFFDGMSDFLAKGYEAGPFRAYVLHAESRRVVYRTGVGPSNVAAKLIGLAEFAESHKQDASMTSMCV